MQSSPLRQKVLPPESEWSETGPGLFRGSACASLLPCGSWSRAGADQDVRRL